MEPFSPERVSLKKNKEEGEEDEEEITLKTITKIFIRNNKTLMKIIFILFMSFFFIKRSTLQNLIKYDRCHIGDAEKCLSCKNNSKQCLSCNKGYYIPKDDENKQKCKKCSIENCAVCEGTKNTDKCILCGSSFYPLYENDTIIKCSKDNFEIREIENCLTFNKEKNQCSICNPGYFLPDEDTTKQKCEKCDIQNCKICKGTKKSNLCLSCINSFVPNYKGKEIQKCVYNQEQNEQGVCINFNSQNKKCSKCDVGYKLVNNKCEINYSFKAIYHVDKPEKVRIINKKYIKFIDTIIFKGRSIKKKSSHYYFPSPGNYEVYILMNLKKCDSLKEMFLYAKNLYIISFTEKFNTISIKDMTKMFSHCNKLTYVDLSHFQTQNVNTLFHVFHIIFIIIKKKFFDGLNKG